MSIEFVSFPSIERLQQQVTITEKIHGTNAQILTETDNAEATTAKLVRKNAFVAIKGMLKERGFVA